MPIPYVDVSSDILKSYMAGKQMAMALQQMQMERLRIQEEKRYHDLQNQHNLASLSEEAKWHASNYEILRKNAEREQKQQEFKQNSEARSDIQKGLYGTTPGMPGTDSSSQETVGASLANAPTSLPSNGPIQLPAMPGVPAQQIPNGNQSPADQTQATINQNPNSPQAISGMGPSLPSGVPTQVTPGLQSGPAVPVIQTPGQDVNAGGVIIPAAQARAIPIKPPLGEAEKLQMEHANAMELEGKRQEIETKRLQEEGKWHEAANKLGYYTASANLRRAEAHLADTHSNMERARRNDALGEAQKLQSDPFLTKIMPWTGTADDIVNKVQETKGAGGGPGTGLSDFQMIDLAHKLQDGTPWPSPQMAAQFVKSTNPTLTNLGKVVKGFVDPNTVIFSPAERLKFADQLAGLSKVAKSRYKELYKSYENRAIAQDPSIAGHFQEFAPYSHLMAPNNPEDFAPKK